MITYEITAVVREDLIEAYERYMRERHIDDVLSSGAFAGAAFTRSGTGRYRIRYEAHDRASLDRYLAEDAPRTRADFARHFPEGVEVSREEWDLLAARGAVRPPRVVPMLHVPSVAATVDWYRSIGFEVIDTGEDGSELVWAMLRYGDSAIMLSAGGRESDKHRREVDLYIHVDDVDAVYRRLEGRV